ncbi:leucine-zipper-like transcriptional regulator 1 [Anaeramoeba flamelloides]|uniref:Leucine-zipper-like transcriptional regulator 1 n=1 Tax=Anaeramoeba flamelloides TaxID=1746091 RepID=A0ABQ8YMU3_9EUKA|nr:leucine-zipper-like transcriptional regulator 1 [Anaeramoeba flamelloides]
MSKKKRKIKNILWSKEKEIKHEGREGCSSVVVGDLVYLYGGFLSPPKSKCTTDLFCYNIALRTIKLMKPRGKTMPPATIGHTMIFFDDKLWIYGGQTTEKGKIFITNKIHYFDLLKNKWKQAEPLNENNSKKKKLLISSSSQSSSYEESEEEKEEEEESDQISEENEKEEKEKVKEKKKQTKKDRKKFELPSLTGSSSVLYKNEMIIVGGFDGKKHNDQIYSYNLANNHFKQLQFNYYQPLGEIKIEDKNQNDLDNSNSENEEVLENVELDENDEKSNSNRFRARYCHSSCLIGDTMFIYGGRNSLEEFSTLYQFNIPDQTYFCSKIVHGKNPTGFTDQKMVTISESRICVIGYHENLKITTAYLYNPILMSWKCLGGTKQFIADGNTLFTWGNNIFSFGGNLGKNIFRLDLDQPYSEKTLTDKNLKLLGKDMIKFWKKLQNLENNYNIYFNENKKKNENENENENENKNKNENENKNKNENENKNKNEMDIENTERLKEKKKEKIKKIRKNFNLIKIEVKNNKIIYFYKPIVKIRFPIFFDDKEAILNQFKKLTFNSAKIFFKFLLSDKIYLSTKNVTNKQIKNLFQILIFCIKLKQSRFIYLCKKWLRTIINPKNILTILISSHKANLSSIKYFTLGWCSNANYSILKNLKNEIHSLKYRSLKNEILSALKPRQIANYGKHFGFELNITNSTFKKDMERLFKDKQSSDIQFQFLQEEKPLKLHSFVIAARSDFLQQLIFEEKSINRIKNISMNNKKREKKKKMNGNENENEKGKGKGKGNGKGRGKEKEKNKIIVTSSDTGSGDEEGKEGGKKTSTDQKNICIFSTNLIIEKIENIKISQTLIHQSNQKNLDRETRLLLKIKERNRYEYIVSIFRYMYGLDFILTFQKCVYLVYAYDSMKLHHNLLLLDSIKILKKNVSKENIFQILQISENCKLVKFKAFLIKKIVNDYWSHFLTNDSIEQLSPQLSKDILLYYTHENDKNKKIQNF